MSTIDVSIKATVKRITGIEFLGDVLEGQNEAFNIVYRKSLGNGLSVSFRTVGLFCIDGFTVEVYGPLEQVLEDLKMFEVQNLHPHDEGSCHQVIDLLSSLTGQNLEYGSAWTEISEETFGIHNHFTIDGKSPSDSPDWLWLLTYIQVSDADGYRFSNLEESEVLHLLTHGSVAGFDEETSS